ncbi:MAG: DUF6630 family protein [Luteimonas sp.]
MLTTPESEYDPDDNFANSSDAGAEVDDEADTEALVWQLLLLINPGDDEAALQQFDAWREAMAGSDPDEVDAVSLLRDAIDWKSGFHVAATDVAGLLESIDELAARWNLRIDWGVEDTGDEAFLRDADAATLIALAHARLREDGYTLWTWQPRAAVREDVHAGWIALRRDDEAMEAIAPALGIDVRPGRA